MSDLLAEPDTRSDAELIAAVRAGDSHAYGLMFERHRAAAQRMAGQLVRGPDIDDLVSEAFTKVLVLLQSGAGPDLAFRAYLLTAIRRLHVDKIRAVARTRPTDDIDELDTGVEFGDPAVEQFEHGATAAAFSALPERWQMVLWHLDVEGAKPADIAPLLGMSANSVSALAYRAREGLRQSYLQQHLADTADPGCRWTTDHLGAYVRKGLSKRDRQKVDEHLEGCRRCSGVYLELVEINSNLGGLLAPVLLGGAAAGYLGTGAAKAGVLGLPSINEGAKRVRELVGGNSLQAGLVAAGSMAVAAAAIGAVYLAATSNDVTTSEGGPGSLTATTPADTPSARSASPPRGPGTSPPAVLTPPGAVPGPFGPTVPGGGPSPSGPGGSGGPDTPGAGQLGGTAVDPPVAPTVPTPAQPTPAPTDQPTSGTTAAPTAAPTTSPTTAPTTAPTAAPTTAPTTAPTDTPTGAPGPPAPNPPPAPPPVPAPPPDAGAVDTDAGVLIAWAAVDGADRYDVFRNPGNVLLGSTTELRYSDADPPYGATVTYSVVAVGSSGTSDALTVSMQLPYRGQIAANPARCVTGSAGLAVTMSLCRDAATWKVHADGTIRLAQTLCITHQPIIGPVTEDGPITKVTVETCTDSPAQRWTFDASSSGEQAIRSVDDPLQVLDILGGLGGGEIVLFPAKTVGVENQRFRFVPS